MRQLLLLIALSFAAPAMATATPTLAPAVERIRALLSDGDVDRAVDAGEAATKALPGDAAAWHWAGRAYGQKAMRVNMLSAARWAGRTRTAFEQAVELEPTRIAARLDLLDFYLMAPSVMGGGRDKAVAQTEAIAALDPSMGRLAQARLARHDKDADQAEQLLREALALDADNRDARVALASGAQRDGDWDTVRALWQAALERGTHAAFARYQLGRAAAMSGESLDAGLAHLDAFIADTAPVDGLSKAAAHWRRGQILDRLGRRDEALAAFQTALDFDDRSVNELARKDLERVRRG